MISAFVYSNTEDFGNWRWKAGPNNENTLPKKANCIIPKLLKCHVRSMPTPAIVLPPEDKSVHEFIECIKKSSASPDEYASAMSIFAKAVRDKIRLCRDKTTELGEVPNLEDAPLCVFIHFGGEDYDKYNGRLHKAWAALQDEKVKQHFLCFAITRGGTSGINQAWLGDDNVLNLPDTNEQLVAVLKNACDNVWGIQLPAPFAQADSDQKPSSDEQNGQPPRPNGAIGGGNPPSANGKNDDSAKSKSDEDQDNQVKIRLNAKAACVLKLIVAIEVFAGFVLSWVKSFFTHSVAVEFGFGVLGLVFLIIPVVLLWNAHEEESPTKCDGNSKLKKALGLPEDADEAKVLNTAKNLKSRVDKQQDKDRNAEAEQFAEVNAKKADETALKRAYRISPEAAKELVAGISVPQAAPEHNNS